MLKIVPASPEDAEGIIAYTKTVGAETDNLSFGKEGLSITVEQEQRLIARLLRFQTGIILLAKMDEEIIGLAHFSMNSQSRMKHRGEIGLSIKEAYWGQGIGSKMMEALIEYAKNGCHAELISLEVRSDNLAAIHLYQKFGFTSIGTFPNYLQVDGKPIACDIMVLSLLDESSSSINVE